MLVGRELPQVIIEPAHRRLDYAVHGLQVHRRTYRHAPSNQRVSIFKFNAKDGDIIGSGHTTSLATSSVRRNHRKASALGGDDSKLQPNGYERATFTGIVSEYWHFRARSSVNVHVWLRGSIGYLLVGCYAAVRGRDCEQRNGPRLMAERPTGSLQGRLNTQAHRKLRPLRQAAQ